MEEMERIPGIQSMSLPINNSRRNRQSNWSLSCYIMVKSKMKRIWRWFWKSKDECLKDWGRKTIVHGDIFSSFRPRRLRTRNPFSAPDRNANLLGCHCGCAHRKLHVLKPSLCFCINPITLNLLLGPKIHVTSHVNLKSKASLNTR